MVESRSRNMKKKEKKRLVSLFKKVQPPKIETHTILLIPCMFYGKTVSLRFKGRKTASSLTLLRMHILVCNKKRKQIPPTQNHKAAYRHINTRKTHRACEKEDLCKPFCTYLLISLDLSFCLSLCHALSVFSSLHVSGGERCSGAH